MPTNEKDPSTSSSGIITNASGDRHIPSSVRADGSTRKEIKIKPGYRPPEDVEVYKNRTAAAWKSRGTGGVPGADTSETATSPATNKPSNKNAKRREARKKAKATDEGEVEKDGETQTENVKPEEKDLEVEKEKQARKLKKKLREARELQEKKNKGEGLLQEQFEKVIKINELIRDLDKLGFDANGEPKNKSEEKKDDKVDS